MIEMKQRNERDRKAFWSAAQNCFYIVYISLCWWCENHDARDSSHGENSELDEYIGNGGEDGGGGYGIRVKEGDI